MHHFLVKINQDIKGDTQRKFSLLWCSMVLHLNMNINVLYLFGFIVLEMSSLDRFHVANLLLWLFEHALGGFI